MLQVSVLTRISHCFRLEMWNNFEMRLLYSDGKVKKELKVTVIINESFRFGLDLKHVINI